MATNGELEAEMDGLEDEARAILANPNLTIFEKRRALDGLRPAERLAQARERAGVLLDRATRTVTDRLGAAHAADGAAESRLRPIVALRLASAHAALEAEAAALAVLGPQATLDRGYAIVRRADDGRIVRRADEAAAGTGLAIRLADGELGASSTGPLDPG